MGLHTGNVWNRLGSGPSRRVWVFLMWSLVLLSLPVTLYLVQKQQEIRQQAQMTILPNQVEAEAAVLSGPAVLGSDQNASNGQYVQFGGSLPTIQPSPTPSPEVGFQPSVPYYVTFYYQWYKSAGIDSSWSYWPDHNNSPPNTWFSHYLPDPDPTRFDPSNELYSSNDYNSFKWQVQKMAEARIEVAIGSWFGPNTREDIAFNNIISSFMGRSDNPYPNLRWSMYYEAEGFGDPAVSTIVSDLNYIRSRFATSPYFLRINGKPVLFVYADANDGSGMAQRWKDANSQLGNYFYIVLKVYSGYASESNQPDSWHQYAPAIRSGQHGSYSFFVSPGFWLDDGSSERLSRDSDSFETAVKSMVSAGTTWKLIETWNEWGEGSSVEPGEKVAYNPTTQKDEPDTGALSSYNYHNLFIDILARNLPPLEQGAGR